jgi:hypothetical protein
MYKTPKTDALQNFTSKDGEMCDQMSAGVSTLVPFGSSLDLIKKSEVWTPKKAAFEIMNSQASAKEAT